MAFEVFEENLDEARDEALAMLDATRRDASPKRRYDWLYRDNPDGEAVLWAVRKVETGEMAGFTVALPRRMLVDGRPRVCWNGADFSIRQEFRTLGVAIKLRRAAKEGVDAGRVDFLYAHPNAKMQLIHEKVGHSPVGTMVRYAKPLRTGKHWKGRLKGTWLPAVAGKLTDVALHVRSPEWRHRPTFSTRLVESPVFDGRFDRLFERAEATRRVLGVRDSRYLDWRYARNPLYRTHAILAEDGEQLAGYLLFTRGQAMVHVKDVLVAGGRAAQRDLIAALIRLSRKTRSASISAAVLEGHPLEGTLTRFGFARRPDCSQMFGYAPMESPLREVVLDRSSWMVSVGDRDV